jgi:hypothetical protein
VHGPAAAVCLKNRLLLLAAIRPAARQGQQQQKTRPLKLLFVPAFLDLDRPALRKGDRKHFLLLFFPVLSLCACGLSKEKYKHARARHF